MSVLEASPSDVARRMRVAADAVVASLSSAQRRAAVGAFHRSELTEWTYLPGRRPGVRLGDLDAEATDLALDLLTTSYSLQGLLGAELVVRTELISRRLDIIKSGSSPLNLNSDFNYWLRILGDAGGREPWAWRISGHHLVANATVVGDDVFATPQFFGANPARVQHGPSADFRGMAQEEDLGRRLVSLLGEDQRRSAVTSDVAPSDISSRYDPVVDLGSGLGGLGAARMDRDQGELLESLIHQYLGRAAVPLANRAWKEITDAGLAEVRFAWAGGLEPGEGHYYAVYGPTFLLEYDNTQDDANHIHSVWRDLRHDWAGDLLARHHEAHHHASKSVVDP